jgi:hypothetical protein
MQCPEFERRLNDVLDERERPEADPLLSAHAAQCERCAQTLAGQEKLLMGLSWIATPALGREFARRIVAEAVTKPSSMASHRAWLSLAACLASAAVMLLAVSMVWYARRGSATFGEKSAAARQSIAITPQRGHRLAITNPGRGQRPAAGRDRPALTGGDWLLEAPRLPGHLRSYRVAIDDLTIALPEAVERLDEVERLAPGMRPLRVSLSMIWDTLCRTLPGACVDSPPPSRGRTSRWRPEPVRVA